MGHEGQQGEFAPAAGQDMQYEIHSRPDMDERPQWSPPHETAASESSHGQRPEPVAEAAAAAQPEPAAPSRRRSTVREAPPTFTASEPMVTPMPAPQPAPQPPAAEAGPADDSAKPRRTGWWAKRLLGGDKG
jgi:ribonuclease E